MRSFLTSLALVAPLVAAAGCSSSSSSPAPTPAEQAEAEFWSTFTTPSFDRSKATVDGLTAVHDAEPANDRNTMLLGAASLWRTAEAGRARDQAGAIAQASAPVAAASFAGIRERDPSNTFATGLLGVMMFDQSFPKDEATMQKGEALMAQAAREQPTFGLALPIVSLVIQDEPRSPRLAHAVDSTWKLFDTCFGTTLDRENPTLEPYLGKAVTEGWARFCWETPRAPHSLRWLNVLMGDALVKQGNTRPARVFYENARLLGRRPLFDGQAPWPHEDLVDERLGSDLEARAATFAQADRTKWAAVGAPAPFACTMCHGATTK